MWAIRASGCTEHYYDLGADGTKDWSIRGLDRAHIYPSLSAAVKALVCAVWLAACTKGSADLNADIVELEEVTVLQEKKP